MAWRWHTVVDPEFKESCMYARLRFPFPPMPPPTVDSDRGYCGMVRG